MRDLAFCVNSHSPDTLNANLRRSPCLENSELHVEANAPSASAGYNRAIDRTDAPILIFAHHDVYLPRGWDSLLAVRLAELDARDPNWALCGTYGLGPDSVGWGPVWSSSLGRIVGRVAAMPMPTVSFDELLIVLRRDSGLRFDENLMGWHMYGTDIAQTARSRNLGAYAGALPCIHNDNFHAALGPDFTECYAFMQRKWRDRLPIRTPVTKVTRLGLPILRDRLNMRRSLEWRKHMSTETDINPEALAAQCGWSDLSPSAAYFETTARGQ